MKYFNNVTGEAFTLEELEKAFEDVREDIEETSFENWLDDQLDAGRRGMDGLVEVEGVKITINFPTGNHFEDGTPEIGKTQEEELLTRVDLDDVLDEIPDGVDYFITDADGNEISAYDLVSILD